jgi:hypothetical protein
MPSTDFDLFAARRPVAPSGRAVRSRRLFSRAVSSDAPSLQTRRLFRRAVSSAAPSLQPRRLFRRAVSSAVPSLQPRRLLSRAVSSAAPSLQPRRLFSRAVSSAAPSLQPRRLLSRAVSSDAPSLVTRRLFIGRDRTQAHSRRLVRGAPPTSPIPLSRHRAIRQLGGGGQRAPSHDPAHCLGLGQAEAGPSRSWVEQRLGKAETGSRRG